MAYGILIYFPVCNFTMLTSVIISLEQTVNISLTQSRVAKVEVDISIPDRILYSPGQGG